MGVFFFFFVTKKIQHLFETEIFCNIINVSLDQFNTFLLNTSINFLFFLKKDHVCDQTFEQL